MDKHPRDPASEVGIDYWFVTVVLAFYMTARCLGKCVLSKPFTEKVNRVSIQLTPIGFDTFNFL